ncbi:hypothetical protein JG688_00009680 [Phytophthora aleatoria]|uniref:Transmembrane protein n=1 Tax=Phytophthora aleatoria TaxID=2496075 RepID=A0A8J5IR63_9STRA|nr:hypothetical protein JG688_00009680 [Phytophthora aleatoria]
MVALIFGQELIPLQELSEGWSASYGMWIRAAVLVGIVTHALLIQATYLINDFRITMSQRLQLYAIMPAIVVALAMVVASNFVFPIPFFILFVTPPFYLLLIVMLRVVIGSNVYEMLFNAAEGTEYQLPVILILPVIKVALKNLVLYFAKALDDMAPVEVIFTADFLTQSTWLLVSRARRQSLLSLPSQLLIFPRLSLCFMGYSVAPPPFFQDLDKLATIQPVRTLCYRL